MSSFLMSAGTMKEPSVVKEDFNNYLKLLRRKMTADRDILLNFVHQTELWRFIHSNEFKLYESTDPHYQSLKQPSFADLRGIFGGTVPEGHEVHRIIPRRYGGPNESWNLMPLTRNDHHELRNWFKK